MNTLVHLNNAGFAPLLPEAHAAWNEGAQFALTMAYHGRAAYFEKMEAARVAVAQLHGVPSSHLAFTANCSSALGQIALALPLKKDDEILSWEGEYAANVHSWREAGRRVGAHLRTVPMNSDVTLNIERLCEAIGARTKVVTVSWIQSRGGVETDLPLLAKACEQHGALLVVDVIQGLGLLPFDMKKMGVDIACGGSHKWLRAGTGVGTIAIRPGLETQLIPPLQGAYTYENEGAGPLPLNWRKGALRFEAGTLNSSGMVALGASAAYINKSGVQNILSAALLRAQALADALRTQGWTLVGAGTQEILKTPWIQIRAPAENVLAQIQMALTREKVSFVCRGLEVRLTPHAFNTESDVARAATALAGVATTSTLKNRP